MLVNGLETWTDTNKKDGSQFQWQPLTVACLWKYVIIHTSVGLDKLK